MCFYYLGKFGGSFQNFSGGDIYGVYCSVYFFLQYFVMQYFEYEYFWNWEFDMCWLGNYYEFFDCFSVWVKEQFCNELWECFVKYYIFFYYGFWENFIFLVYNEILNSGCEVIYGLVQFFGC